MQGDGKGFPDLILIRRLRLVVAELKTDDGKATPEQEAWLLAFAGTSNEAYTWRPRDWGHIESVLS